MADAPALQTLRHFVVDADERVPSAVGRDFRRDSGVFAERPPSARNGLLLGVLAVVFRGNPWGYGTGLFEVDALLLKDVLFIFPKPNDALRVLVLAFRDLA